MPKNESQEAIEISAATSGSGRRTRILTLPERTEARRMDEADRLPFSTLERLRDADDRRGVGLVLLGMPALERRLARYAQRSSRVGFVHQVRALSADAPRLILAHRWTQRELPLTPDDVTEAETSAAIPRGTGGNVHPLPRLFSQIERTVEPDTRRSITPAVVNAARQSLVIGTTGAPQTAEDTVPGRLEGDRSGRTRSPPARHGVGCGVPAP